MKRREFITLLGGAATWPVVAHAQSAYRIGVLDTTSAALLPLTFERARGEPMSVIVHPGVPRSL